MPNTLKIKRGTAATIPNGQLAEPLFTTDTYDLYIGKGNGSNQRFQKYIASGTSSQFLKGDGSLDSNTYQTALTFSSPLVNTSGTISIPAATGSVNGYLTSTDWTTFNSKEPAITAGTSLQYYRGDKTFQTLNTSVVPESGAIYFTEPRVLATVLTGLNLSGGGTIAATDSVLTAFGKIQNQISGIAGGVSYQGTWNANTNSPTLTSSVGTKGYYYVVSVNGSTNLNGITDWKVGDWAIFNGTTWDKVDNTDAVSSVNGFTGAVNLGLGNISDVTLSSPTNAQLLRFNGTSSKWENWTPTYISAAITSLNGLTAATQTFATGTTGTDFTISSSTSTHTFNIPSASATSRGLLTSNDYNTFAGKQSAITLTTTGTSGAATFVASTLNIPQYQAALTNPVTGTGTNNEIAYFNATGSTIASLSTATYPSLTELSYVKGVTSAIQTQLNSKQATISLTTSGTSGAATFSSNTLNIPNYSTIYSADGTLSGNRTVTAGTNTLTFSSSRTSGTPFSFNSTQTAANASDVGDGVMAVNHTITGSTGTELVIRAMSFGITNGMSGGTVTNYRGWNVASNTSAGSTTTNLDQVYIEAGTYAGTVTSSRAIRINNMLGTNRAAIAINALGGLNNNVYLLLGDITIPTGNWGIYQSESSYSNYLNGNTSIGTTTGGYRLNVAGTGNFSGALTGTSATFTSSVLANNPSEGATGEGLITGRSFKIDATGAGQRAVSYMVSNTLSDTYGSGLQAQYSNFVGDKAFGFNLNTSGGFELYTKSSGSFGRRLLIDATGAATFSSSVSVGDYLTGQGTNPGGLGGSRYVVDFNAERTRLFSYGSNTSTNGNFLFNSQRSNGTNSVDIMYLSGSGNVGIGTTSPTTYSLSGTHVENYGGSTYAFIHNNTATVKSFLASNESALLTALYTYSNHPLTFGTNNTERMRISSGGTVTISNALVTNKINTLSGSLNVANNTATFMVGCTGDNGTGSIWLIIAAIGGAGSDRIAVGILATISQGGGTSRWVYQSDGANMFLTDPGANGYIYVRQTTGSTQTITYSALKIN